MSLSPDSTKLAALHLSGTLSLWQVPSLRQQCMWSIDDQVCYLYLYYEESCIIISFRKFWNMILSTKIYFELFILSHCVSLQLKIRENALDFRLWSLQILTKVGSTMFVVGHWGAYYTQANMLTRYWSTFQAKEGVQRTFKFVECQNTPLKSTGK